MRGSTLNYDSKTKEQILSELVHQALELSEHLKKQARLVGVITGDYRPGKRGPKPSIDDLTFSEQRVLDFLLEGLTNIEISKRLGLVEKTVKFHVSNIFKKKDVRSRSQLMVKVFQERNIPMPEPEPTKPAAIALPTGRTNQVA